MLRIVLVAVIVLAAVVAVRRGLVRARESILARLGNGDVGRHDFSLLVRGWSESELERILSDYCAKYELPRDTFLIEPAENGTLQVRSHSAIGASHPFTLVNYIYYPEGFQLTGRKLAAVCALKLSRPTGFPPGASAGESVAIYVPADDQDYDLTYVQRASGQTYRVSFTNFGWVSVENPRLTTDIRQLIGRATA